jgi:hypothetical protein
MLLSSCFEIAPRVRFSLKENGMQSSNATEFNRRTG